MFAAIALTTIVAATAVANNIISAAPSTYKVGAEIKATASEKAKADEAKAKYIAACEALESARNDYGAWRQGFLFAEAMALKNQNNWTVADCNRATWIADQLGVEYVALYWDGANISL